MKCGFRINFYDHDGDVNEKCVMLDLARDDGYDTGTILKFKDVVEIERLVQNINKCIAEIRRDYPEAIENA